MQRSRKQVREYGTCDFLWEPEWHSPVTELPRLPQYEL